MVDDSELDHVRTFLGKVHTAATVKHIEEAGDIIKIVDATFQRMLVYPPEIIGIYSTRVEKRYLVKVSETSEANLTTAINNIQIGIEKANRRETITAWTKPASWCYIKFINSNKAFYNFKNKRYELDIYLDIEWSMV